MATYKGIQGYTVQKLSSDPTASSDTEGQLWYNSGTGKFKIAVAGAGAWSSGGNLNTTRGEICGIGTKAATLAVGGSTPALTAVSETYDGSAWTAGNSSNTAARNRKGTGTTTAAMIVGGWGSPAGINATEYYDGTCWTTQTGTLTRGGGYQSFAIAGASQASAVIFGGQPGTTYSKYSESWDGTSWSEGNDLNTLRQDPGGAGIITAALCIGGYVPPGETINVESYDGSCWTETSTDVNTARAQAASGGTSTACLYYGGTPGAQAITESFNGSTWTEVADLATGRYLCGGVLSPTSSNTSGIAMGGQTPPLTNVTEEWSDPVYANKTVTVS